MTSTTHPVPPAHVAALLGHKGTAMLDKRYGHLKARVVELRKNLEDFRN